MVKHALFLDTFLFVVKLTNSVNTSGIPDDRPGRSSRGRRVTHQLWPADVEVQIRQVTFNPWNYAHFQPKGPKPFPSNQLVTHLTNRVFWHSADLCQLTSAAVEQVKGALVSLLISVFSFSLHTHLEAEMHLRSNKNKKTPVSLQMLARSLWTQTRPTDSSTCLGGTGKLLSRETPSHMVTALPGSTPCPRSCVWSLSLEGPTTGRLTGAGRGPPSVSPTKPSRGQATETAAASATTANLGASSALTPATQRGTTRTS